MTFNNIPTLVSCSVGEPAAGIPDGWNFVSVTPSGSVAVVENQTITFTVVNERELGSVKVVKDITDEPVAGASTEFTVNLDCFPGTDYDHIGIKLNEGDGWTVTFDDIPSGVTCSVTEPEAGIPAGWTFVSVTPAMAVAVEEDATITFTVVNERELGSVKVVKDITGEPVAGASTEFTVNLDCSPGTAYDHIGIKLNEGNGWSVTFRRTSRPGSPAQVTEPAAGIPDGWNFVSVTPSPGRSPWSREPRPSTFTVGERPRAGQDQDPEGALR